jgi:hypothetical protein
MAAVIPQEHFRLTKGAPRMFARQTGPAKVMECWFCQDCGTRLYHMPGGAAYPNRNIKPGTLDDSSWVVPTHHFWTRGARQWVVIPEHATRHETQPDTLGWDPMGRHGEASA